MTIALMIVLQSIALSSPAKAQQQFLTYEQAVGAAEFLVKNGHYLDALLLLRQLPLDREDRYEVLFLRGLAAMELSNRALEVEVRDALLDEAVEAFFVVTSNNPGSLRPRLELARAYFMRGDDEAAKEHFEWVLATRPPAPVTNNIQKFLAEIRSRRRLTGYFGFAMAPDTNIANVYESREISILGLPFVLNEPAEAKTGVGLSLWGGGEYRVPVIPNKLSLRLGASTSITNYPGSDYDSASLGVFAGPHYQIDNRTETSLVGYATQRWSGGKKSNWDLGARLHFARQVSEIQRVSVEIGSHDRIHRFDTGSDGNKSYIYLGSDFRLNERTLLNLGYSRFVNDADNLRSKNDGFGLEAAVSFALEGGYDLSFSAEYTKSKFGGNWFPFIIDGSKRSDHVRTFSIGIGNRNLRLFGFSPKLTLTAINKSSNVQNYGFDKNRAEFAFVRYY